MTMTPISRSDAILVLTIVGALTVTGVWTLLSLTATVWMASYRKFAKRRPSSKVAILALCMAASLYAFYKEDGGFEDETDISGGISLIHNEEQTDPISAEDSIREIPEHAEQKSGEEPTREASSLPGWFLSLGYPDTDTDEDGIPDCWEKWTHTWNIPATADPDGDGLTNAEEFLHQTDPIRADTDGDGIDDTTEVAGLAAGLSDLDPLVPATFATVEEPDTDADGIPDAWEGSGAIAYHGFPWHPMSPTDSTGGATAILRIDSTRTCALVWSSPSTGNRLILPPCAGLTLRVRIPADPSGDAVMSLEPVPGATGTWRASLRTEWEAGSVLATEDTRARVRDGTVIDASADESRSRCYLGEVAVPETCGAPLRGNPQTGATSPRIAYATRHIELESLEYFCCSEHGPTPVVVLATTNAPPPYLWQEGATIIESDESRYMVRGPSDYAGLYSVTCTWKDRYRKEKLKDRIEFFLSHCEPGSTNLVGAGWSSSHNPTNATDHLPGVYTNRVFYGPLCPVATNLDTAVGWTHATPPDLRDLIRITTGDARDDDTDHCLGLVWGTNLVIRLDDYLDPVCTPYRDRLSFQVQILNGRANTLSNQISQIVEPADLNPAIFHVSLFIRGEEEPADRLWIVVNSRETKRKFDDWVTKNATNMAWTATLPRPYTSLVLVTNGTDIVPDPSVSYPGWKKPKKIHSFLHHNASFEMRSENVGPHGHQATYDQEGQLMTNTIAAGTADYRHPLSFTLSWSSMVREEHYREDVLPFLCALSLDGNPSSYNRRLAPTNLTRPCLYQGPHMNQYIQFRPIQPTGIQERTQ